MSWTSSLAESLGCPESALKLVLGQLAGYPLFLFHFYFLKKSSQNVQHLFFALSGLLVASWAIGSGALFHGPASIIFTFIVTRIFKGSLQSTVFLFFFHIIYLLWGYFSVAKETYDISWTMPHCVMCLRLIGLAMDVHDGQKKQEELSKDQKEAALQTLPSILEMFSHCFFIGGYFVGPQFSMRKYQEFIRRNIEEDLPPSITFGLLRFFIGVCYLVGHLIGSIIVPESFVESEEFFEMGIVKKSFYFSLWVKVILAKYISLWLLSEGTVILSGLAYNGRDSEGNVLWNGGANVKLRIYEKASRFQHLIDSFNINTNAWVMSYVYKRLRFLNNRLMSQAGALVFLAVWHGYHSGYYVTFIHEFLVINFEKQFFPMLDNSSWLQPLFAKYPPLKFLGWIFGKFYHLLFLPHCFLPFPLLKHRKYLPVMMNTYCGVFLFFGTWVIWKPLAKMILKPEYKKKD